MFVGVGASRVRDLFEQGKKPRPVHHLHRRDRRRRPSAAAAALGGGHDEREQTLNQLLVEMDGFESNRRRHRHRRDQPSRTCSTRRSFARVVSTARSPSTAARREGPRRRSSASTRARSKLGPDVDLRRRSRAATPGFSGADLANLVNEAAIARDVAGQRLRFSMVTDDDFELRRGTRC